MSAITSKDRKYFNLALNLAGNSSCRYRHGAVIVRGGNIISTGINKIAYNKNTTKHYGDHCITIHAEMKAVLNTSGSVKGTTLYSARMGAYNMCISKPCDVCTALMKEAGIYTIVYYNGYELVKERL